MACLANVTLFAGLCPGPACMTSHLAGLHVWTIAELALLVLIVSIVSGVGTAGKVIVAPPNVVVGAGGRRKTQVRGAIVTLDGQGPSHSKSLRAHLRRVEARVQTEFARPVSHTMAARLLHALVELLLGVNVILVASLVNVVVMVIGVAHQVATRGRSLA